MTTREAVVARILELCGARGFSINHLAYISAVPSSTLKNIINGNSRNTGIVTLKMLCDGFGITLVDFFNTDIFISLEQELK